jgi:hypothetical protein
VEAEPSLLEVVRSLHLNPLRAQVVPGLRALARYPWTGHSALLGAVPRPWQATAAILAPFGPPLPRARRAYRTFVADGSPQGRRPDLQGGGLVRSLGGWGSLLALRQRRAAYAGDARILGSSQFVAQMQREGASPPQPSPVSAPLASLCARVCAHGGIPAEALPGGGRVPAVTRARAGIAYLWVERLGRPGRPLAAVLGLHPAAVYPAARRGTAQAKEWEQLLTQRGKAT